ncbi:MAG: hypothetical protein NVS9B1_20580 [Candidatus Dormibacteraceae bacterium]
MKRAAVVLVLGVLACSGSGAAAPPPAFGDLLFTSGSGNAAVSSRDGTTIALPPGLMRFTLTAGGDVGEGYIVGSPPGGIHIERLLPARRFTTETVADQPGTILAGAELVPAPELTSFVGPETVLVTLTTGGGITGYQHGTRIWVSEVPAGSSLRRVGNMVFAGGPGAWARLAPESGGLQSEAPGCEPIAALSVILYECPTGHQPSTSRLKVFVGRLPVGPRTVIEVPQGEAWLYDGVALHRLDALGQAAAPVPLAGADQLLGAPDGRRLYFLRRQSVEVLDTTSLKTQVIIARAGPSIALSRDGNYLYSLGGGTLATYSTASGALQKSVTGTGERIELVAGG